jgi:integrase
MQVSVSMHPSRDKWRVRFKSSAGWKEIHVLTEEEAHNQAESLRDKEDYLPRPQRRRARKPVAAFEHGIKVTKRGKSYRVRRAGVDASSIDRRFRSEAEAKDFARVADSYLARGQSVSDARRTVAELAEDYLDGLADRAQRYRDRQNGICEKWIVPAIGTVTLQEWTPRDSLRVLNLARKAELSEARISDIGVTMRGLVSWGRRVRWLTPALGDPMDGVRYSRTRKRTNPAVFVDRATLPSTKQVDSIIEAFYAAGDQQWGVAVALVARTGLRWGEVIALRPRDIDLNDRLVHVTRSIEQGDDYCFSVKSTKNQECRDVPIPASVVARISGYVRLVVRQEGGDAYLFPSMTSTPFPERTWWARRWAKMAKAAGWKVEPRTGKPGVAHWSIHDLRHFYAAWAIYDARLPVEDVSVFLGHANPAFTYRVYVSPRSDFYDRAHEVLGQL